MREQISPPTACSCVYTSGCINGFVYSVVFFETLSTTEKILMYQKFKFKQRNLITVILTRQLKSAKTHNLYSILI